MSKFKPKYEQFFYFEKQISEPDLRDGAECCCQFWERIKNEKKENLKELVDWS